MRPLRRALRLTERNHLSPKTLSLFEKEDLSKGSSSLLPLFSRLPEVKKRGKGAFFKNTQEDQIIISFPAARPPPHGGARPV